jgi:GNAT superfamily N-acetyltransferase
MSRRLVNVTLDNLSDLPVKCRSCAYWELDPAAGERAQDPGGMALEKEAWVSDTLLEWGNCGQLAYVDGVPAGYALYAPPAYVPRSVAFATSPVSADAVLLMTARVLPEFASSGLGRVLLQTVARETVRRGVRAIEAFGRSGAPRPPHTSARDGSSGTGPYGCVLPADYLRAVGFTTIRPHPRVARLRLEIRTTQTWREDVEYAIDRLFGSIQSPVLSR